MSANYAEKNDIPDKPDKEGNDHIVFFPNPHQYSLSVKATALIFADEKSRQLESLIERIAPSDATVLIKGETGTGKELVARHLHALSSRSHGPFVAINCSAFPETLVESELFGHEKGAFTGATSAKDGWFVTANGGTLFLDEIGDLPLSTQVKLLRVLQEREVVPIGSRKAVPIDVRLVTATNVNLTEAVKAGRFREDLYYRIKVVPVDILPLRERPADIFPLVNHFLKVYKNRLHTEMPKLLQETIRELEGYAWPGNIRELENVIHRALLVCDGKTITPGDLNLPVLQKTMLRVFNAPQQEVFAQPADDTDALAEALHGLFNDGHDDLYDHILRTVLTQAFDFCNRNQVQTANMLGISRNVLRTHLKNFKLIS